MKAISLTHITTVGAKPYIISQDGQVSSVELKTERDTLGVKRQVSADWLPTSQTGTNLDSDGHILSCEKKKKETVPFLAVSTREAISAKVLTAKCTIFLDLSSHLMGLILPPLVSPNTHYSTTLVNA